MKLLYVITRSDVFGGASIHLLDIAQEMVKKGHEVLILIGGDGVVIEKARELNIPIKSLRYMCRELSPYRDFRSFFEIRKNIVDYDPDLIHLHSSKAGILGRLASFGLNIPVVFTAHGWAFTEGVSRSKRVVYKWVERLVSPFCSKIITVSNYDRQIALQERIAPPDKIVTIHNGVHSRKITYFSERKNLSLIMVARFDQQKNQPELLKALSVVKNKSFNMNFVGDGYTLANAKRYCESLGLSSRVNFLGAQSNVSEHLSRSDIFLLISNWEGFPLTTIEAMSHGLPVIVSNVGGAKEALTGFNNGYVVERGDIEDLANKITLLIESHSERKKMGENSLNAYESHFSFEVMFSKIFQLYCDLVKS